MKDNKPKRLCEIVDAPKFMLPWLDRFYEPLEIRILEKFTRSFRDEPTDADRFLTIAGLLPDQLERFFLRGILSKDHDGRLSCADFHTRYDIWALFEGFKDIPHDIRDRLNQWELNHYICGHKKDVEQIRQTGLLDPSRILPRYLQLKEAIKVLDEAAHIYLWPCNCRSMIQACKSSVYTCLRFDNSQGQGFEVSREKAKEIVLTANKNGLMQSGELGWNKAGKLVGAICNCCPDCCFPHLLAKELKAEKIWPKSLAVADWRKGECSFCGLCAKRCPFGAFEYDKKNKEKNARMRFNKEPCRGCGLCAVTCPKKAIELKKIKEISC
ncbi:MAG: 4Fe-4S binding protein [Desulfobacula sp.]|nr:4Fe-4S binding protein [Desulfobacula sp.]